MKRNQHTSLAFSGVIKALSNALNSLFFSENKDFQRLKNFIAS